MKIAWGVWGTRFEPLSFALSGFLGVWGFLSSQQLSWEVYFPGEEVSQELCQLVPR